MFRIGVFARMCQVSVRTLRLYDEMGLIKPALVDEESGYPLSWRNAPGFSRGDISRVASEETDGTIVWCLV